MNTAITSLKALSDQSKYCFSVNHLWKKKQWWGQSSFSCCRTTLVYQHMCKYSISHQRIWLHILERANKSFRGWNCTSGQEKKGCNSILVQRLCSPTALAQLSARLWLIIWPLNNSLHEQGYLCAGKKLGCIRKYKRKNQDSLLCFYTKFHSVYSESVL